MSAWWPGSDKIGGVDTIDGVDKISGVDKIDGVDRIGVVLTHGQDQATSAGIPEALRRRLAVLRTVDAVAAHRANADRIVVVGSDPQLAAALRHVGLTADLLPDSGAGADADVALGVDHLTEHACTTIVDGREHVPDIGRGEHTATLFAGDHLITDVRAVTVAARDEHGWQVVDAQGRRLQLAAADAPAPRLAVGQRLHAAVSDGVVRTAWW